MRKLSIGRFGETLTCPSPPLGAVPTKNMRWRLIHAASLSSISSKTLPIPGDYRGVLTCSCARARASRGRPVDRAAQASREGSGRSRPLPACRLLLRDGGEERSLHLAERLRASDFFVRRLARMDLRRDPPGLSGAVDAGEQEDVCRPRVALRRIGREAEAGEPGGKAPGRVSLAEIAREVPNAVVSDHVACCELRGDHVPAGIDDDPPDRDRVAGGQSRRV